jgi:methylenetetrahydrofolate dehydrogenase (NADP+)/methenyltetrahydrofolate cyclohydrolase
MTAHLIDGKRISRELEADLAAQVTAIRQGGGRSPTLAVILVGDEPASAVYVKNKRLACERVGFIYEHVALPATIGEDELLAEVRRLNADPAVHGFIVQLPLPKGIDERRVIEAIDPRKDVDGFHPYNLGLLTVGLPGLAPATPSGIMQLLAHEGISVAGQEAVVIGRSAIVGRPLSLMLTAADATVTLCHSRTRDLGSVVRRGDLVVAAVGRPGLVTADMIKPGATVIDVGTNRLADGRLVGDVDFEAVSRVAGAITPVPGGVGPMTIHALLQNTLRAYRAQSAPLAVSGQAQS